MHGCIVLFVAKNLSNYDIIDSVFRYKKSTACKACFLGVPLNWPALPGLLFQRQREARAEEEAANERRREQQRLWDLYHNPGCAFPCFD